MKTVLITAIASFSGAASIKGAGKAGLRVIGMNTCPGEWVANSKDVDVYLEAPMASDSHYMEFIMDTCDRYDIDCILPSTDPEVDVLNAHREILEAMGVTLLISPYDTILKCRDKVVFAETINGLLKDYSDKTGVLFSTIPEITGEPDAFPVVVKPVNGRSSIGLHIVNDSEEFSRLDTRNCLVQPFINGPIIAVDVVRHPNGHTEILPREEVIRTSNGAGLSVRVFRDALLEDACKLIAEKLGIVGLVVFEFIQAIDCLYILECNPRFAGGVAFSTAAGYDTAYEHFRCFMNDDIDSLGNTASDKDIYIARRYEEYVM